MTQEITAYLSDDGRIFRSRNDAQFADYLGVIGERIAKFVTDPTRENPADPAALLLDWELHRIGGRPGWEERNRAMQPRQAGLSLGEPVVAAPDAPAPAVEVPLPRAKPGPKPKAKQEPSPNAIAEALEAARVTQQRKQAEERPRTPAAYRKHVAVVGLFNIHHANVEKEFGHELKLSIFDADCMSRLQGLRACHKVIVMTKFVSHKHIDALKAIGQEPLLIHGGMDKLKEALTNIYVNS